MPPKRRNGDCYAGSATSIDRTFPKAFRTSASKCRRTPISTTSYSNFCAPVSTPLNVQVSPTGWLPRARPRP